MNVSIVICCYNSASRLPQTIQHLLAQEVPKSLLWEVIVVDNACTDDTAQVARTLWPGDAQAKLRVVSEPEPGLSNARRKGFEEAQYDLLSFVDDDNWVAPNWVRLVSEIMSAHPEVGALGGRTKAVFEDEPPWWFECFQQQFVVGEQQEKTGYISFDRGYLWGAGLTIRKSAWKGMVARGFQSLLSGRKGQILVSGEDNEISHALILSGWKLYYDSDLCLRHFMASNRLNWNYLRKLNRGHGITRVGLEPYEFALKRSTPGLPLICGRIWVWQAFKTLGKVILWHGWDWTRSIWADTEGSKKILGAEYHLGRLLEILKRRNEYDQCVIKVWSLK
jgi:glycosyltransferase involved in cell wall biosynthesis